MRQKFNNSLRNEIPSTKEENKLPSLDEIFHNLSPKEVHQFHYNLPKSPSGGSFSTRNNHILIPSLDAESLSSSRNKFLPIEHNNQHHYNPNLNNSLLNPTNNSMILPRQNVQRCQKIANESSKNLLPSGGGYQPMESITNSISGRNSSINNYFPQSIRPSKHYPQSTGTLISQFYSDNSNSLMIHNPVYEQEQEYSMMPTSSTFQPPIPQNTKQLYSLMPPLSSKGQLLPSSPMLPSLPSMHSKIAPSPSMITSRIPSVCQPSLSHMNTEYYYTGPEYSRTTQCSQIHSSPATWNYLPRQGQNYENHTFPGPPYKIKSESNVDHQEGIMDCQTNISTFNSKTSHFKYRSYSQKSIKEGMIHKRKRQNIPKEITRILISWLEKHLSNPYPTNKEKTELLQKTNLTIQQLDTWFINTRKRKVNEMKKNLKKQDN